MNDNSILETKEMLNDLVYIDIYYVDDRPPLRVLCNTVDVCPNNTCRINGGLLGGTTIYNTCGAEVVRESIKNKSLKSNC